MLKCKECGKIYDVNEVVYSEEKGKYICNKCGDDLTEFETLYNVGDKVSYLDISGDKKSGTILEVDSTDIYEWNKVIKPLYLITNSPSLRSEEDILRVIR